MKNQNILISGAGVSGLALAYWLRRYGFSPVIVERSKHVRTGGFKIDIRGVAIEVLKSMGLYAKAVSLKTDIKEAAVVDSSGNFITEMDSDTYDIRLSEDLEILRGDLCAMIYDQIHDVEFIFEDSIKKLSQNQGGVYVEFQRTQARMFDLVIGADGLHSVCRKLVFGDESSFSKYLGLYISIFSIPNHLNLDRKIIECAEPGKIAILYSSKRDADAKAAFLFSSEDRSINHNDVEKQKKLIASVYANFSWEIPRILTEMNNVSDFYFDSVAQIHMNCWTCDRVTLIGDAACCASPVSGQGTSIALVSAYVLAGELAATCGDYQKSFASYENEMRHYVEENQRYGRIFAKGLTRVQQRNKIFNWLQDNTIKVLPKKWANYIAERRVKQITRAANAISLKNYSSYDAVLP